MSIADSGRCRSPVPGRETPYRGVAESRWVPEVRRAAGAGGVADRTTTSTSTSTSTFQPGQLGDGLDVSPGGAPTQATTMATDRTEDKPETSALAGRETVTSSAKLAGTGWSQSDRPRRWGLPS